MRVITQILPYASTVVAALAAWWAYANGKGETKLHGVEVLDARQEQIAQWGFEAADEANKRAERIATEAAKQVQELQRQLNELRDTLEKQTVAHQQATTEYEKRMGDVISLHKQELSERDGQIVSLHLELVQLRERIASVENKPN